MRSIYIYIYDIRSLRVNDLTLILLTWKKWRAPNNASKWQMGFNSVFKGLNSIPVSVPLTVLSVFLKSQGNKFTSTPKCARRRCNAAKNEGTVSKSNEAGSTSYVTSRLIRNLNTSVNYREQINADFRTAVIGTCAALDVVRSTTRRATLTLHSGELCTAQQTTSNFAAQQRVFANSKCRFRVRLATL